MQQCRPFGDEICIQKSAFIFPANSQYTLHISTYLHIYIAVLNSPHMASCLAVPAVGGMHTLWVGGGEWGEDEVCVVY